MHVHQKIGNGITAMNGKYISLVNAPSDEVFTDIILTSKTWAELGVKLGYKRTSLASNVKESIKERCKELNIELQVEEVPNLIKMTKGEMFDRANHWTNARIMIQRIAKRCFRNANKERKCAVCGYDKHIDVAHIKAVADFDDSATLEEINNPDNLIGLCPNHHWEYDHGLLDLEKYLKKK